MTDSTKAGLRVRIGVICPDDGINDDEYWGYLPPLVTLLWTRYRTPRRFEPISVEMVASYGDIEVLADAAQTLRITRPNAVLFACNSCSFVHGRSGDARIREAIGEAAGCPATSVTQAQLEAIRTLEVKRVAIGAPYQPQVTAKLEALLASSGIEVTASRSLGLESEWEIGNSPSSVWYDLARSVDSREAQAVLLACSGIRTLDILDRLERELAKPVISAPAASVWHALRLAGVRAPVPGRGILLEQR